MPCSPNSPVALGDVTLNLVYTNSGPSFSDDVSVTVTYSRVNPLSPKRFCYQSGPPVYDPLTVLNPGEYLIDGNVCCPCFGHLTTKQCADTLAGTRTLTAGGTQDIFIRPIFFIDLISCSQYRNRQQDYGNASPPVACTATITQAVTGVRPTPTTPGVNAEQILTLSGSDGNFPGPGAFLTLSWTPPVGTAITWTIDTSTLSGVAALGPNIGDLLNTFSPPADDNIQVTRRNDGLRFGFVKRWGSQPVNPITITHNSLTTAPQVLNGGIYGATFELLIGGLPFDSGSTSDSYNTPCKTSFVSTFRFHLFNEDWTYTMTA